MKKLIIIAIIIWALVFAWIGFGAEVVPAYDLLNLELGKPMGTSLTKTPHDPLIGALKRALYKYPDQIVALCQAAASGRCGETTLIQNITEMGLYVAPANAPAIVQAIYAQCPEAGKGIERAMNAKLIKEPKSVIEPPDDDEPTSEPTPPPNIFNFPPPPPSGPFIPVTPVTDVRRK